LSLFVSRREGCACGRGGLTGRRAGALASPQERGSEAGMPVVERDYVPRVVLSYGKGLDRKHLPSPTGLTRNPSLRLILPRLVDGLRHPPKRRVLVGGLAWLLLNITICLAEPLFLSVVI